jgi:hypothetical protein
MIDVMTVPAWAKTLLREVQIALDDCKLRIGILNVQGATVSRLGGLSASTLRLQEVSAAIDDAMGELVTATPAAVQKPNYPSVADPARSVSVA